MPREDGVSPSELFCGRKQKQQLPALSQSRTPVQASIQGRDQTHKRSVRYRNAHTTTIRELQVGEDVWMQHHESKEWNRRGKIIAVRAGGKSYVVQRDDLKELIRGRRFLRPVEMDRNQNQEERAYRVIEFARSAIPTFDYYEYYYNTPVNQSIQM